MPLPRGDFTREIEALISTLPPEVLQAYTASKQKKDDIRTPPGASPRPNRIPLVCGSWEPEDRR